MKLSRKIVLNIGIINTTTTLLFSTIACGHNNVDNTESAVNINHGLSPYVFKFNGNEYDDKEILKTNVNSNTVVLDIVGGPLFSDTVSQGGKFLIDNQTKLLPSDRINKIFVEDTNWLFVDQIQWNWLSDSINVKQAIMGWSDSTKEQKIKLAHNVIDVIDDFGNNQTSQSNYSLKNVNIDAQYIYETINYWSSKNKNIIINSSSWGAILSIYAIGKNPNILEKVNGWLIDSGRLDFKNNEFGKYIQNYKYPKYNGGLNDSSLWAAVTPEDENIVPKFEELKKEFYNFIDDPNKLWSPTNTYMMALSILLLQDLANNFSFIETYSNFDDNQKNLVKNKVTLSVAEYDTAVGVMDENEMTFINKGFDNKEVFAEFYIEKNANHTDAYKSEHIANWFSNKINIK